MTWVEHFIAEVRQPVARDAKLKDLLVLQSTVCQDGLDDGGVVTMPIVWVEARCRNDVHFPLIAPFHCRAVETNLDLDDDELIENRRRM